jgi:REP element-mobilizing transposase RayT
MILSEIGKICEEELQKMLNKRLDVDIHNYVIMPNHVHLLFYK